MISSYNNIVYTTTSIIQYTSIIISYQLSENNGSSLKRRSRFVDTLIARVRDPFAASSIISIHTSIWSDRHQQQRVAQCGTASSGSVFCMKNYHQHPWRHATNTPRQLVEHFARTTPTTLQEDWECAFFIQQRQTHTHQIYVSYVVRTRFETTIHQIVIRGCCSWFLTRWRLSY